MSMSKESWERAMVNAYSMGLIGTVEVSSCTSHVIGFPVNGAWSRPMEPFTRFCLYCRGVLTVQEKECPGCGARSGGER